MKTDLEPTIAFSTRDITARYKREATREDVGEVIIHAPVPPRSSATGLGQSVLAGATLLSVLWPGPTVDGGARLRESSPWTLERGDTRLHRPSAPNTGVSSEESTAQEAPRTPSPSPAVIEALHWIKGATGLSQDGIAALLQVTRQTLYKWENGTPVSPHNLKHLLAVREVLGRAASRHTSPADLVTWLYRPRGEDARTPADLLAAGEFGRARLLAFTSPSPHVRTAPAWIDQPTAPELVTGREPRVEPFRREADDEPIHR